MPKIFKATWTAALLILSACGTKATETSQVASNYPPDYNWNSRCAYNDVVEVCRSENSGGSFIHVYYKGQLKKASELKAYIKLNGRDGTFGPFDPAYGDRRNLHFANTSFNCRGTYDEHGFTGYDCQQPSDAMRNLLYYAKNQFGVFNAWDIEIAFVDQDGHWDSNLGGNYKLRIE